VSEPGVRAPADLLRIWHALGGRGGSAADDPWSAVQRAASLRDADEPLLVAGSLYLVGALRGMLLGETGP
jgi:folylpolyglutamate synthase/dihydropteroate synthase